MNTVPALTKTVLDDLRYVGQSYEWLQMADEELSRKKEWSVGDYAAAIFSLVNFGYSVYKTIDDGKKLIDAAGAPEPARILRPVAVLRKTAAVKKTSARRTVKKRVQTKVVKYRRLS
jgi:hypothetical protein